jgi:Fe-S cluster biosynthesis and repair protein YggX
VPLDKIMIHCLHCNKEKEPLSNAPMPSDLGKKIQASICTDCWKEWMTMSTKVINENRLQLFKPEHRQILEQQMRLFLGV